MLFSSSFVSAAFMLFSSVTALPQPENGELASRTTGLCAPGSYLYNATTCAFCPAGSSCDGKSGVAQPCGSGHYQPSVNSTACLSCDSGHFQPSFYQNAKGANNTIPCPAGSYQPYGAQAFCYGAPKGRFQGLPGQATVCGTCCGWAAPLVNNNISPVNCNGTTPNAWPNSGDGCISSNTTCVRAASCGQLANGTCPADTFSG
ncbi:hypothetical protein B0H17DRAFT_1124135 [Mycena rosella]|uniref:Tyrosine-protein kinase ephrin type A/B receptor-like domain-containing protein n=1 Tax=Mycena rosella TaxID=1033263 RepID=A0AAD7H141_MYCRO|nr:hypothetical protein B0H17DRAFT_1124135 [Mycena rosella]